jgi:hypothetical protein
MHLRWVFLGVLVLCGVVMASDGSFNLFSASICTTFLSTGIATSISVHYYYYYYYYYYSLFCLVICLINYN